MYIAYICTCKSYRENITRTGALSVHRLGKRQDALALEVKKRMQLSESGRGDRSQVVG